MENVLKLSQVDFSPHVAINSSRVGRNLEFLGNRYDDALSLPRDAKVNLAFKPRPALPQHLRLSFHLNPPHSTIVQTFNITTAEMRCKRTRYLSHRD